MKKRKFFFAAILYSVFCVLTLSFAGGASPDTVNGWYFFSTSGPIDTTYSRIVSDTSIEGTKSQGFTWNSEPSTYIEFKKKFGVKKTPKVIYVSTWLNKVEPHVSNGSGSAIRFYIMHGDTNTFLGGILKDEDMIHYWDEASFDFFGKSPPVFFDSFKIVFVSNTENVEWFLDNLRLIYPDGSIIVLDSFGDPPVTIDLTVKDVSAFPYDTVSVPLDVVFPDGFEASSFELKIGGFQGQVDFLDIDTNGTLIGSAGWTYSYNETDTLLVIASAGANNISGSGTLLKLKFAIPWVDNDTSISIDIFSAVFNIGMMPVNIFDGVINVISIRYGDVDLNWWIQAYDASQVLKYLAGYISLNERQLKNADVTLDKTVSALDASVILQYVVGLIDSLPYTAPQPAQGMIAMHDDEIVPGTIVIVPLDLSNGKNILSFEGKIAFNQNDLEFQSIRFPSASGFSIETRTDGGTITFTGASIDPDGTAGTFAEMIFRVNDSLSVEQTTVMLKELKWNEEAKVENVAEAILSKTTGIKNPRDGMIPKTFALHQNYPNPFNPVTAIRYELPMKSVVKLEIYNVLGQKIETLADQEQNAGYYEIQWNGKDAASGIYFCILKTEKFMQKKKMILMK